MNIWGCVRSSDIAIFLYRLRDDGHPQSLPEIPDMRRDWGSSSTSQCATRKQSKLAILLPVLIMTIFSNPICFITSVWTACFAAKNKAFPANWGVIIFRDYMCQQRQYLFSLISAAIIFPLYMRQLLIISWLPQLFSKAETVVPVLTNIKYPVPSFNDNSATSNFCQPHRPFVLKQICSVYKIILSEVLSGSIQNFACKRFSPFASSSISNTSSSVKKGASKNALINAAAAAAFTAKTPLKIFTPDGTATTGTERPTAS